jgi:hypothetical protein
MFAWWCGCLRTAVAVPLWAGHCSSMAANWWLHAMRCAPCCAAVCLPVGGWCPSWSCHFCIQLASQFAPQGVASVHIIVACGDYCSPSGISVVCKPQALVCRRISLRIQLLLAAPPQQGLDLC